MKKEEFLNNVAELLEIKIKDFEQEIKIDSIGTMTLISFIDENFNKTIKMDAFEQVKSVNDLIKLVGEDLFE
jgi:acyl carrier protein